ncbi:MAG: hypothetical protein JWP81_3293 [Ferruginibacter sp.]|nr:hypothetical protein [Ferruginibacter sp.]
MALGSNSNTVKRYLKYFNAFMVKTNIMEHGLD